MQSIRFVLYAAAPVAEGVIFSTGRAVLSWLDLSKPVEVYQSMDEVYARYGARFKVVEAPIV